MLLNIRLMLVAIAASVAAIASGLGLFATFRINHEPWSAYSKAGPPLQLVAIHEMRDAPMPAALFGGRSPSNAGQNNSQPESNTVVPPPPASRSATTEPAAAAAPLDVVTAAEKTAPAPQDVAAAPQIVSAPEQPPPAAPPAPDANVIAAIPSPPESGGQDAKPAEPAPPPAQANLDPTSLNPVSSPKPDADHVKEHRVQRAVAKPLPPKRAHRRVVQRAMPQTVAGQPTYQWTRDGLAAAHQTDQTELLGAAH